MPPAPPLPLTSLNRASPGAVVWRHKGQLSLTAVVKATFSLVAEGRMTLADPDPIAADEQPDPSGRGLRAAGDLAPYLGHVNVSLTGHVEVPPHYTEPVVRAWLAVVQNGASRIDKRLELDASVRAGEQQRQVPIRGLDPISRHWPVRRNLLGDLDPRRLEARIMELPEAFDWRYFQTVPADQRLPMITGDEWIVLGGMLLRRPRLRTQLPFARGVARLYRRGAQAPREGEPIALRADMIHIDVDRLRCAIVWRGHAQLRDEAELPELHLAGGVEMEGESIVWADPFAAAPVVSAPDPAENPLEGTMAIPTKVLGQLTGLKMPFSPSSPAPAPQDRASQRPKTPPAAPPLPAAPPPLPAVLPSPDENPIGSTLGLIGYQQAELAKAPATPFEGRPVPQAPRAVQRPRPAPPPAPPVPAPGAPPAPPLPLDAGAVPALAAMAVPPAHGPSAEEIEQWPPGLGAEFLAAMADAGALAPA